MNTTVAVEVDEIGVGEIASKWWTRQDQNGLYSAWKFATVTSQPCHLKSHLAKAVF